MHFIADENTPAILIQRLRQLGHVVEAVAQSSPGVADGAILDRAIETGAVIITFDKDFGELAHKRIPLERGGVILMRASMSGGANAALRLAEIIDSRTDWTRHFSVIDEKRIRMRPLY